MLLIFDQLDLVGDFLSQRAAAHWRMFLGFESRLSALQLLFSAIIAAAAWRLTLGKSGRFTIASFRRYLLPRSTYLSRSSAVDAKIFVFNAIFSPARRLMFGASVAASATIVATLLQQVFSNPIRLEPTWTNILPMAILVLLVSDLSTYLIHRLSHRWPVLWAFHRVHHSATSMTPLTVSRKHPFFDVAATALRILLLAPLWGVILFVWQPAAGALVVMVTTVANGLFATFAANLRHSHVWISYGPWLERALVSPAMHQIHHSKAPEHWDRNYGEIFALWDWAFGTHHPAGRPQELEFGLVEGEIHRGLRSAMLEPFQFLHRYATHLARHAPWFVGARGLRLPSQAVSHQGRV